MESTVVSSDAEPGDAMVGPVYNFTPKHRWQIKLHMMSGITLRPWLRFLWRHARHIDWGTYWHRVAFLSTMAVVNSLLAIPDWLLYGWAVHRQPLHPEPLFILGHPRTGTTHLHNLLSLDPAFAYCTTFHAGFPSSFLSVWPLRSLLSPLLEERRPMDNMALSWELPAEDEIATNTLSGGTSPYACIVLPREAGRSLLPYYTFEFDPVFERRLGLSPAKLQRRLEEWRGACTHFMKKVTFFHTCNADAAEGASAAWWQRLEGTTGKSVPGHGNDDRGVNDFARGAKGPKPLLIKSPVHTARVDMFLNMFPKARFIYIHRHPLQVFQSAAHMADTYYWYTYLHTPSDRQVTDFILDQYDLLYDRYMKDKDKVPKAQLHELSFEELEADPIAALRAIYAHFGWQDRFEALVPRFKQYCESLSDFKKNHFNRLSPEMTAEVSRRWAPSFKQFGYT